MKGLQGFREPCDSATLCATSVTALTIPLLLIIERAARRHCLLMNIPNKIKKAYQHVPH